MPLFVDLLERSALSPALVCYLVELLSDRKAALILAVMAAQAPVKAAAPRLPFRLSFALFCCKSLLKY